MSKPIILFVDDDPPVLSALDPFARKYTVA